VKVKIPKKWIMAKAAQEEGLEIGAGSIKLKRRTKSNGSTWEEWWQQLIKVGHLYSYNIEATGQECWRVYFDDDYSPPEALREDLSSA
jgi:hypothetical protein